MKSLSTFDNPNIRVLLTDIDGTLTEHGRLPPHSYNSLCELAAAGIHVVEHLTRLEQLPPRGARFTAAPPAVAGFGTFPVRAFATL